LAFYIKHFKLAFMGNVCSWAEDEHATEAVPGPEIIKQPDAKAQESVMVLR
jgi:hypothetical protein